VFMIDSDNVTISSTRIQVIEELLTRATLHILGSEGVSMP
jgi:hypothetical protein